MTVWEALANIGCPVVRSDYRGNARQYIVYQIIGQSGTVYAEGREAATGIEYAVVVWSAGPYISLLVAAKSALESAGYITTVDMEYYDSASGYYHVAMIARSIGANYG